jgi:acyl-coenzyme A synthetase/AMP-(fatty) acid ligase
MYQGYGHAEVLPIAMMRPRQWFAENLAGSQPLRACGLPLLFGQLQIWDEDNKSVQLRETGTLVEDRRHRSPRRQRRGVREGGSVAHRERTGRARRAARQRERVKSCA